jgi:hypothetical protein
MVVHADEDLRICQGDTAELSAMFFGGTPPFEINWSPDSVFPNDTSLMVYATPDSSTNYYVTVTDSNGLSVTDTIFVHVSTRPLADIYISAIDTFSTCQSATLKIDSLHDVFYSWNETSNPATLSNTSELNIIYNGTYRLVAQENSSYWLTVCPMAIDSIVFNYFSNPAPEINLELECNYFVVHSNENLTYQWYLSNVLISDSIRDTLFVDSTGYYNVIGVDTSGCMSAVSIAMLFQTVFVPLSLSVSIGHPSCDTCSDGYVNLQGNGGTNWYHYSMNGLPSGRYIDSLSAGLYQFCVYDDNNCMVCDNAVYVPVNEISFKAGTYFPNPFSDKLHFNYPHIKSASSEFILFDATGREVKRFPITSNEFYLTRESLTPGIFFFIIVENGNVMDRGRVILN